MQQHIVNDNVDCHNTVVLHEIQRVFHVGLYVSRASRFTFSTRRLTM